jgi:hypothetical protein
VRGPRIEAKTRHEGADPEEVLIVVCGGNEIGDIFEGSFDGEQKTLKRAVRYERTGGLVIYITTIAPVVNKGLLAYLSLCCSSRSSRLGHAPSLPSFKSSLNQTPFYLVSSCISPR